MFSLSSLHFEMKPKFYKCEKVIKSTYIYQHFICSFILHENGDWSWKIFSSTHSPQSDISRILVKLNSLGVYKRYLLLIIDTDLSTLQKKKICTP